MTFSTNIKLDRTEDNSNRIRLAKLLRSQSSHHPTDIKSLDQYVEKTKEKKRTIYASRLETSEKGYEVFTSQSLWMNSAFRPLLKLMRREYCQERVKFDESERTKENWEATEKEFEPLLNWMKDKALKDKMENTVVSQHLRVSLHSCGWSSNMERIMRTQVYQIGKDISTNYYANQKKTFDINPRHPLIRDILQQVKEDADDETVLDPTAVLFETVALRLGYLLPDTKACGGRINRMLCLGLNINAEEGEGEKGGGGGGKPMDASNASQRRDLDRTLGGSWVRVVLTPVLPSGEPRPVPR
ncbi:LOW QUALITY PROTEIN: hypothetical protein U0070_006517 [Myodes glareolus]|uniref:Heat shock protein 90 n=1 Tax=Myodes glareolus TaxID=447135 RepID=A0AAW0JQB6_MYOGA